MQIVFLPSIEIRRLDIMSATLNSVPDRDLFLARWLANKSIAMVEFFAEVHIHFTLYICIKRVKFTANK